MNKDERINGAGEAGVVLDKKALRQTDKAKIAQIGHGTISGDAINVACADGLRRRVS